MREARRFQAPVMASLVALLIAAGVAAVRAPPSFGPGLDVPAPPRPHFDVPGPENDFDLDGWNNTVDVYVGNLFVAVEAWVDDSRTIIVVGTQDDQWQTGTGRPLEWMHVVDMDPLDAPPGSAAWQGDNLRTGQAVRGQATGGHIILPIDVAEDGVPHVTVEAWLHGSLVSSGTVAIAPEGGRVTVDTEPGLRAEAWPLAGPSVEESLEVAERWAPTVRFDSGERIFPVSGATLAAVDGFYPAQPDLRVWRPTFNNGRDGYRLLQDHYNNDGVLDHRDVALRLEGLAALGFSDRVVHAHVTLGEDLGLVVQYWFLYPYNFVLDASGRDIPALAHKGDREFVQLTFDSLDRARDGAPTSIAYSQHYGGIVLPWPDPGPSGAADDEGAMDDRGQDGAGTQGAAWEVFVSRGSHASYPVAGDDRRSGPALRGYYDRFDGEGEVWEPDGYTVELLRTQPWQLQGLWGPLTRFSRDIGTPAEALLRHDFRYPFVEPWHWEDDLSELDADSALRLYGRPT